MVAFEPCSSWSCSLKHMMINNPERTFDHYCVPKVLGTVSLCTLSLKIYSDCK